jgi:hypothetical protein
MTTPADITLLVVMVGQVDYWSYTRPFIANYAERHGYRLRIFTEDCMADGAHPSWQKLLVPSFARTPHVLLWDADLVPLPWAPPIHTELSGDLLGMVKIEPSRGGRVKLRRQYGFAAATHLWWNCGLISVPHRWKPYLRDLFFTANRNEAIFWEQGALNHALYTAGHKVHPLDPRWNCWVSGAVSRGQIDTAHCLHFAKGSARRMRNIGMMYKLLRLSGRLPEWANMTGKSIAID